MTNCMIHIWFLVHLFILGGTTLNSIDARCIEEERIALLNFKAGLDDPLGYLSFWDGKDCCSWVGVGCNNQTGNVVKLDLRRDFPSQLRGKLSPSLLDLKQLIYLDLSWNSFKGMSIPTFLGSFKKLTYLNFSSTFFKGEVPPQLGNLSNLRYLDLSYAGGSAQDLDWLTGLTSLVFLDLSGIKLRNVSTGWLKVVSMLPSLSELHLEMCELEDLPLLSSTENFTSLSVIDLSYNYLGLELPLWLFNISTLLELDLRHCNITGPISHLPWPNLHNLEALDLRYNKITDDIGLVIDVLSKSINNSLQSLNLKSNRFSGELGDALGGLSSLRWLVLAINSISGAIPTPIRKLSFLEELDLSFNKMDGNIPESVGELVKLFVLDLKDNNWEGKISESHFNKLKELEVLQVSTSNGEFVLDLPHNCIPPFSLKYVSLCDFNLGPGFPTWLRAQRELEGMELSNVQISKPVPDWLWELAPQFLVLDLSYNHIGGGVPYSLPFYYRATVDLRHNHLQGSIPLSWGNISSLYLGNNSFSGHVPMQIMPLLNTLDLSSNSLNGTLPTPIVKMTSLRSIDVSGNNLSGSLLGNWDTLRSLGSLDLSNNKFCGNIVFSMCSAPILDWLDLSDNKFEGDLPLSLQNCSKLAALNLRGNKFSGHIPTWFGMTFSNLGVLSLRMNNLTGTIPREFCDLSSLHALDLAHNNFTGVIPPCFGNLHAFGYKVSYYQYPPNTPYFYRESMDFVVKGTTLTFFQTLELLNTIDLSNNRFLGGIPDEITQLTYLGTLNLSNNQLTGNIPDKLERLKALETLDLSFNNLSGPIPLSLSSLTSLNHLHLEFNNLSGPIPTSNQFNAFIDPSIYEGNPGLCGTPLFTSCSTSRNENQANKSGEGDEDDYEMFWFYVSMGLGFIFGYWVIFSSLVLKRSWRIAYFRFLDTVVDRLFIIITPR